MQSVIFIKLKAKPLLNLVIAVFIIKKLRLNTGLVRASPGSKIELVSLLIWMIDCRILLPLRALILAKFGGTIYSYNVSSLLV